jgi:Rho GDP-dissociation inhibitor
MFGSDFLSSGMLARSGTYVVKSRVVDDDGEVYAGQEYLHAIRSSLTVSVTEWAWSFKLAKEW